MSKKKSPVRAWIDEYKEQFERYNKFCTDKDWTNQPDIEDAYKEQEAVVGVVIDRLKYFVNKFESFLDSPYVITFMELMNLPVKLYLKRCNTYFKRVDWTKIKDNDMKITEMNFQTVIMTDYNRIKDKLQALNLDDSVVALDLPIHSDKKIPFLMSSLVEEKFPQINEFKKIIEQEEQFNVKHHTAYDVINSTEMFINIKNPPIYDANKHYFEQKPEVIQFYEEELKKITKGVTIAGVFIHPWLYWHINFFKTDIPMDILEGDKRYNPNKTRLITTPYLRDNELFIADCYKEASENNVGLFFFGTRRYGKALKNNEKVYYSDGKIGEIGDCKIGESIIGGDGKPTKILGVYPQGKVPLYKVSFRDGREVVCCDEHLWNVFDYQSKVWKTLPLKQIAKNYSFKRKHSGKQYEDGVDRETTVYNFYIPNSKPIQYDTEIAPFIDPYFFGLYLGDGSSRTPTITSIDKEIIDYVKAFAKGYGLSVRNDNENMYHITSGKVGGNDYKRNKVLNLLKDNNIILNKHIPEECFKWSIENRLQLLRGLMNSDGYISKGGSIIFTQENKQFTDSFYKLCLELGIHCRKEFKKGNYIKKNGELNTFYNVYMYTEERVFNLERKHNRSLKKFNISRKNKTERIPIVDIQYIGEDEATCIRVDNKDKLFLTSNCVVTHNTVIEASILSWRTTITENTEALVIGGDKGDLEKLSKSLEVAFSNINPAFELTRNNNDWNTHIQFGLKSKAQKRIPYGDIFIRNVNGGKANASEKTAGATPSAWIVDEAGKFNCKAMYQAAIPSFGNTKRWAVTPILTGTGGNKVLSADAQDMLMNPVVNRILPMNWDRLDNMVKEKDLITWKRREFGIYLPAQMSFKPGLEKIETNMADYMGVDDKQLKKIDLIITDWENANKIIDKDRALLDKDRDALNKEKMYFPKDPLECFLNRIENPFCAVEAEEHKQELVSTGRTGRPVNISRDMGTTNLKLTFSDKKIASFPFKEGNIDAPVIIYEDPPEDNTMDGTNVAGLDHYKYDKSSTDSIGSAYIFKRNVNLNDEWGHRIVASYASRPDRIEIFNQKLEMLLEGYGAECLQENADISFQIYLRMKNKEHLLLANGEELARDRINTKAVQNNKYGLNPNPKNQQYLLNLVINYCNEDIEIGEDEEGNKIIVKGVTRIPDIYLLEEIIGFNYTGNFDRITAFGHALAWARYLDFLRIMPEPKINKRESTYQKQLRKNLYKKNSPYSTKRNSPYRIKKKR